MLKKVHFKNYRCFENSEILFRRTAIVVGQNNAGKSTIVEALRILSAVAQKFKHANYVSPPKSLGLPIVTKGIKVNIDYLKMEEIGKFYGVSKMAVSKRLKKLHEKLKGSVI